MRPFAGQAICWGCKRDELEFGKAHYKLSVGGTRDVPA